MNEAAPEDLVEESAAQDVDESGEDKRSEEEKLIRALSRSLDDLVAEAFEEEFGDEEIARLNWSESGTEGTDGELTIQFEPLDDRERVDFVFESHVHDGKDEQFKWDIGYLTGTAQFTFKLGGSTLGLDLYKDEDVTVLSDEEPDWDYRISTARRDSKRQPSGTNPEYFEAVWFSAEEESSRELQYGVDPTHDGASEIWPVGPVGEKMPELDNRVFETPELRLRVVDEELHKDATLEFENEEEVVEEIAGSVVAFMLWRVLLKLYEHDFGGLSEELGFPGEDTYQPKRAVNLNPHELKRTLEQNGYYFPWHVLETACSSLNSGKHVIFTGPPGCGKSKLAKSLAEEANRNPLIATASPAWTTAELMGRYLPRKDGDGLMFRPGLFLRSAEQNRWLIVDEFNRADIDSAFGELFSVLAGDRAVLPFQESETDEDEVDAEEETSERVHKPVRIVPSADREQARETRGEYRDYDVQQSFRLIGTMNDSDRSRLHQLSYALQRRFNIIRVEAPEPEVVRDIIKDKIDQTRKALSLDEYAYKVRKIKGKQPRQIDFEPDEAFAEVLESLFAKRDEDRSGGETDNSFRDLVAERVVGIATVDDIISFMGEGLRSSFKSHRLYQVDEEPNQTETGQSLVISHMAMAVKMTVFPQLEALVQERKRLKPAIRHILSCFEGRCIHRVVSRLMLPQPEDGTIQLPREINEFSEWDPSDVFLRVDGQDLEADKFEIQDNQAIELGDAVEWIDGFSEIVPDTEEGDTQSWTDKKGRPVLSVIPGQPIGDLLAKELLVHFKAGGIQLDEQFWRRLAEDGLITNDVLREANLS